jgi:glycine betaine/proline transport system substrate-binding protein
MFARWKLKFLADPQTVYGEEENLHTLARPRFARDFPEVAAFLKAFYLDDRQIGSLMDAMNRHESEPEAVRSWMADHAKLVDSWLGPAYK